MWLTDVRVCSSWMAFALVTIATESAASAPRLVCYPLMAGESITGVSIRLTRDPHGWRQSSFQIVDRAAGRFVPKTEYAFLRPEWQACMVEPAVVRPLIGALEMLVLVCSAAVLALLVFVWFDERRRTVSTALEAFGSAFIREFERPLVDVRNPQPVLRAELSVSPSQRTLEVRLGPAAGKRYPNLSDHRTNLQYDVERVVGVLNDRRFVCGPLSARGSWVAIPFRLETNLRKEGGS